MTQRVGKARKRFKRVGNVSTTVVVAAATGAVAVVVVMLESNKHHENLDFEKFG